MKGLNVIDTLSKYRYFLDDFSFLSGSEKVPLSIRFSFYFVCRLMKGWGLLWSTITQCIEVWDLQMGWFLKVSWIKLREGGRSTRCVASCCFRSCFSFEQISWAPDIFWTRFLRLSKVYFSESLMCFISTLLVHHPAYQGSVLMLMKDGLGSIDTNPIRVFTLHQYQSSSWTFKRRLKFDLY